MLTNNQGDNHSTVNFFLIRHRKQPKEKKCKQTKRKKRKKESNPFSVFPKKILTTVPRLLKK